MPKQIFQRPAHINRNKGAKTSGPPGQQDWSRKKKGGIKKPPEKTTPDQSTPQPDPGGANQD